MTFKEKWEQEHPEKEFNPYKLHCPFAYGYESNPKNRPCLHKNLSCPACWDREIPEEAPKTDLQKAWETIQTEGCKIKDSGDRTQFETGAVRDMREGKGRMDLLPWSAIMEVSKHCENGAKKYGEHNVDKGIPTSSLCDSAARHLAKYLEGWTDEPHLIAAAWNLLWAIQMEIKNPEVVNTPWNLRDGITTMKQE